MKNKKYEARPLLVELPDDCSLEDARYRLHVAEKIYRGIERAAKQGTFDQDEVERKLLRWTSK